MALRLVAADPRAVRDRADLAACAKAFSRILEVGWMPGQALAFVDLSARDGNEGGRIFEAHLVLAVCGPEGTTREEALALRAAAETTLTRHPAPYRVEQADPEAVLAVEAAHTALIAQRSITLADGDVEVTVPSRFDRNSDSWLTLAEVLLAREGSTRLRTTVLATELSISDHIDLREALARTRGIAERAEETDRELWVRAGRAETTLHDLLESFRSPVFVAEVAVASDRPLPVAFLRSVGASVTSELDVIEASEVPVVAARRRLVGGFSIERDPQGHLEALRAGLPLHGGIRPRRLSDLVSLTEASCAFQWPIPAGRGIPTITQQSAALLPLPAALAVGGALLGSDPSGAAVHLDEMSRRGHLHVLGATGTGKTTLLARLVEDDLEAGRGFVVLDPHGGLADHAWAQVERSGRPGWLIDPDNANTARLSLFEGATLGTPDREQLVERSVNRIVEAVTSHLPTDWAGPRFRAAARAALTVLALTGGELADFAKILTDRDHLRSLKHRYEGPEWAVSHLENFHTMDDHNAVADWVASKFDDFSRSPQLGRVLAPSGAGQTLSQAAAAGIPVVVRASKGSLSVLGARLLGHLVLSMAIDAGLERTPEKESLWSIYVDEAHTFPVTNLERALAEGRKFGLGMVLSHQHLSQLTPPARDAVLGNVAARALCRLTPNDAALLSHLTGLPERDLMAQPDLHAYLTRNDTGGPLACSLLLDPLGHVAPELPRRHRPSDDQPGQVSPNGQLIP